MAKASAHAPEAVPVISGRGGASESRQPLPMVTETWDTGDGSSSVLAGPVEVVEMDGGLGEQSKAEQIMIALRGDGTAEEFSNNTARNVVKMGDPEKPAEVKTEEAEAKPETRKDLLRKIDVEKRARTLEAQLKSEQAKNKVLTEGTVEQLMAARGLTRMQALEALAIGGNAPVDPNPEKTALEAEVARLSRIANAAEDAQVKAVVDEHIADIDAPLVKGMKRIPQPRADGTVVLRATHDVIADIAEQLWIEDGRPPGGAEVRRTYIAPAAERLQVALAEEYPDLVAAEKPKAEAPARPTVPAVGKRGAPTRQTVADDLSGMDDYSRRLAIKQRFGV